MVVTDLKGHVCHITNSLLELLGTTRAAFMAGPPPALDMAPSKAAAGAMLEHLMLEPFASLHKYAGPAVGSNTWGQRSVQIVFKLSCWLIG